ncbi:hypothetical protein HPB49_016711 [Dermacentor silvarum]|uniref:Uncharacterized protein n=1 Tax=Dermacentor silvarum TaxID=543639 RepID=A0ACB8DJ87_DERSI|nr:hypothetical protein HPB49_016711 [Dermacentor silvarum]
MRSLSVVVSCLVAVACLLPAALWAYPSGAPVGVCNSELPKHGGAEPQASQSPYAIQATPTSINQGGRNAITHNSRDDKTQVVVTWTAPAGYTGQVYFSATVVQSSYVFWKGITSDAVFVQ